MWKHPLGWHRNAFEHLIKFTAPQKSASNANRKRRNFYVYDLIIVGNKIQSKYKQNTNKTQTKYKQNTTKLLTTISNELIHCYDHAIVVN